VLAQSDVTLVLKAKGPFGRVEPFAKTGEPFAVKLSDCAETSPAGTEGEAERIPWRSASVSFRIASNLLRNCFTSGS